MLKNFHKKIPIKIFMVGYLGLALLYASFILQAPDRLVKGFLIVAIYALTDLLWTRVRDKVWYLPASSLISGLILALVAPPDPNFFILVLLPLAAVFNKQVLRLVSGRHIFNPAAFSLVAISFAGPEYGPSWWAPALLNEGVGFATLFLVGIFILWRQNRWETALAFFIPYVLIFKSLAFDSTPIFFATVMLIEPVTSTFPTKKARVFYGALVCFFAVLITYAGVLDPLILGLLLGNLLASLLFLKQQN